MRHQVSIIVGILDPHQPGPRIAQPTRAPAWFAALLFLEVWLVGLIGQWQIDLAWELTRLSQDMVAWLDRIALEGMVWSNLPVPVVAWGVG